MCTASKGDTITSTAPLLRRCMCLRLHTGRRAAQDGRTRQRPGALDERGRARKLRRQVLGTHRGLQLAQRVAQRGRHGRCAHALPPPRPRVCLPPATPRPLLATDRQDGDHAVVHNKRACCATAPAAAPQTVAMHCRCTVWVIWTGVLRQSRIRASEPACAPALAPAPLLLALNNTRAPALPRQKALH
jgi:hypothetical protein